MFRDIETGGRQAILPETLDPVRIGDMTLDDIRFARPYAMRADSQRRLWLDATQPTSPEETEHMPLMITVTLQGYCVTVQDHPEAGWDLESPEELDGNYGDDVEYIPVAQIFDPRADRRL